MSRVVMRLTDLTALKLNFIFVSFTRLVEND
nr:MAG TPA: hypothetical protein [Caudoviricetes sp.]